MNLRGRIGRYFRREKGVAFMLAVIALGLLANAFAPSDDGVLSEGFAPGEIHSEESRLETTRHLKETGERLMAEWAGRPELVLVSSLFVLLLGTGVLLDIALVFVFHDARPGWLDFGPRSRTAWAPGDVFKVFVMLVFVELAFSAVIGFGLAAVSGGKVNMNLVAMGATLLRSVLVLLALLRIARVKYGVGVSALGLSLRRPAAQAAAALVSYLALLPLYAGLVFVLAVLTHLFNYEPPVQVAVQVIYTEDNARLLFAFALFMGIIGPFFEEIFFRGFLYQSLRSRIGPTKAMWAASVLFAAMHMHWVAFLPILLLGLGLNVLYEKTGSILPGAMMHMVHNTAMLVLTFQMRSVMGGAI